MMIVNTLLLIASTSFAYPTSQYNFSSSGVEHEITGVYPEYHNPTEVMDMTGDVIADYLSEMGVNEVEDCAHPDVDIIYFTWTELNERRRNGEFGPKSAKGSNVQGLFYFPFPQYYPLSRIYMSNSLTRYRKVDIMLGHEMAHYWWARLCINEHIPDTDTETFAREIQSRIETIVEENR